jgi:membrane protease YdiL (CAAX protease family)
LPDATVDHGGGFTDAPQSTFIFVGGWVAAQIVAVIALSVLGYADTTLDRPVAVLGVVLVLVWSVELAATATASRRAGSGEVAADIGLSFSPIDLIGVPIGIAAQLGLVRLVYLPLQSIWPDTFSKANLEENARELVDGVDGAALILLFVLIVVGAPVVEEIFYRGLLQRPWLGRFGVCRTQATAVVVVAVAAVFALIHFRPIEFPGLFAFGLVVGAMAALTGRIGMSILTHIAFNATALALVV